MHALRQPLRRALIVLAMLAWPAAAHAVPAQSGSVDLLTQSQAQLQGLAGSQAGTALAVLPGLGRGGRDAVAIGMPDAGVAGRPHAGAVAVVFGAPGLHGPVDLSALNGRNGFLIFGAAAGDGTGFALAAVPRPHATPLLAIGAPYAAQPGMSNSGAVYLIDPRRIHRAVLDLASATSAGTALLAVIEGPPGSEAGYALAAGTLSAQSSGDLLIGAPATSTRNGAYSGEAFLVFGRSAHGIVDLLHPHRAAASILGAAADAGLGSAVAITPAGDGPAVAWVGSPTASPAGRNLAGAVAGLSTPAPGSTIDLAHARVAARIYGGAAGDGLGNALALLAPLGRRPPELAVGASGASPRQRRAAGEVVLLPLPLRTRPYDLIRPTAAVTVLAGANPFDGAGTALSPVVDPVRRTPALAIGAPFVDADGAGGSVPPDSEDVGAAYVLGGARGALPGDLGMVGSAGVTITGARAGDQAGTALAGGWLTGPRPEADLVAGAPNALSSGGTVGGVAYVIAGAPGS